MGGVPTGANGGEPKAKAEESDKDRRRREARERDARAATLRPLKRDNEQVERRIEELEKERSLIEPQLADPALYNDFQKSRPLLARFDEIRGLLETLYAQWEKLQEKLAAEA